MLQKEKERNAKKESQKPIFGEWIWKTLKDMGKWIQIKEKSGTDKILGGKEEGTIEVYEKRYILGPIILENLLGFEGFEIESTEAKSTIHDLIKDLSEEEWDWIEMDLEEVKALTFMKPLNPNQGGWGSVWTLPL